MVRRPCLHCCTCHIILRPIFQLEVPWPFIASETSYNKSYRCRVDLQTRARQRIPQSFVREWQHQLLRNWYSQATCQAPVEVFQENDHHQGFLAFLSEHDTDEFLRSLLIRVVLREGFNFGSRNKYLPLWLSLARSQWNRHLHRVQTGQVPQMGLPKKHLEHQWYVCYHPDFLCAGDEVLRHFQRGRLIWCSWNQAHLSNSHPLYVLQVLLFPSHFWWIR